jgi:hypothetical protein
MCGQRSSIANTPLDVRTSSTSRSPKLTRRIAPSGSASTRTVGSYAAADAPIAMSPRGIGAIRISLSTAMPRS